MEVNTSLTNGEVVGGGEVLEYMERTHEGTQYIDWDLVEKFSSIPWVKALIIALLVIICIILILRLFNIKSIMKSGGIKSELDNINNIKTRDKYILLGNKTLRIITKLVESSPFSVPLGEVEYLQYNINRAGIKVPGGYRSMTAQEYNATITAVGAITIALCLLVTLFVNTAIGAIILVGTVVALAILPNTILRTIVREKDKQIRENFADFYLMLHYVLTIGGSTPLDKLMKSYAKTTDSLEMLRFVDNCVGHIDIHGEYNATSIIAKDYREIAEVTKLMRMIKQMFDGADITEELVGFRDELMKERRYNIEKKVDKLVGIAQKSFNLLMIILGQAIISAMTVYFPDLSMLTSVV